MKKSLQELAQELQQNSQQELQATRESLQSVLTQHENDLKQQLQSVLSTMRNDTGELLREAIKTNEALITQQMSDFYGRMSNFQQELHTVHQRALTAKESEKIPYLEQFSQLTILGIGFVVGAFLTLFLMMLVMLLMPV